MTISSTVNGIIRGSRIVELADNQETVQLRDIAKIRVCGKAYERDCFSIIIDTAVIGIE
jgi:hypothetical protein